MPALHTYKLTDADRDHFRDLLKAAAAHFGIRSPRDLGPYVQPFIPVKFSRYLKATGALSFSKVTRIAAQLRTWQALPPRCLPEPKKTQNALQSARLLLLTRPVSDQAWRRHLEDYVSLYLTHLPGKHSLLWQNVTGTAPTLDWTIERERTSFRVSVSVSRATADIYVAGFVRTNQAVWLPVVIFSWCHEGWLRLVDYLWRCTSEPIKSPEINGLETRQDVSQRLRARMGHGISDMSHLQS